MAGTSCIVPFISCAGRVESKKHLNQSKTCEHSSSTHFAISGKRPPATGVPFGGQEIRLGAHGNL
ncbi:hypothetical protein MUK42_35811 [Musa troglodytarum]|uniref:Uncharacterized protein n=1 Tax=Musa troglodytarum TaxID=320322 RepID=A0A9E7J8X7_9LILI|nr:hypothetical protein MUK42_35811 [Musa troglodytarum]